MCERLRSGDPIRDHSRPGERTASATREQNSVGPRQHLCSTCRAARIGWINDFADRLPVLHPGAGVHQIYDESAARTVADIHPRDRRRRRFEAGKRTRIAFDESLAHKVAIHVSRIGFPGLVIHIMLTAQLDRGREACLRNRGVRKLLREPCPQRAVDAGESQRLWIRIVVHRRYHAQIRSQFFRRTSQVSFRSKQVQRSLYVAMQIENDVGIDRQLHDFDAHRLQLGHRLHRRQCGQRRLADCADIGGCVAPQIGSDLLGDGTGKIQPVAIEIVARLEVVATQM